MAHLNVGHLILYSFPLCWKKKLVHSFSFCPLFPYCFVSWKLFVRMDILWWISAQTCVCPTCLHRWSCNGTQLVVALSSNSGFLSQSYTWHLSHKFGHLNLSLCVCVVFLSVPSCMLLWRSLFARSRHLTTTVHGWWAVANDRYTYVTKYRTFFLITVHSISVTSQIWVWELSHELPAPILIIVLEMPVLVACGNSSFWHDHTSPAVWQSKWRELIHAWIIKYFECPFICFDEISHHHCNCSTSPVLTEHQHPFTLLSMSLYNEWREVWG